MAPLSGDTGSLAERLADSRARTLGRARQQGADRRGARAAAQIGAPSSTVRGTDVPTTDRRIIGPGVGPACPGQATEREANNLTSPLFVSRGVIHVGTNT